MKRFYLFFFFLLISFGSVMAQDIIEPIVHYTVPSECTNKLERTTSDGSNNYNRDNYRSCLTTNTYNNNLFSGKDDIYRLSDRYDFSKAVTIKMKATSNARDLDLFIMSGSTCIAKSIQPAGTEDVISYGSWNSSWRIIVDGYNTSQNGSYTIEVIATCKEEQSSLCSLSSRTLLCNSSVSGDTRNENDNLKLATYNEGSCLNLSGNTAANNPFTGNDVIYGLSGVGFQELVTIRLNANTDLDMFIYECIDGKGGRCINADGATSKSNESVTLRWSSSYIIIIDSPNPNQNGSYTLSAVCTAPCSSSVDEDCDNILFDYEGSNGNLTYEFSASGLPSNGSWTAKRNGTELNLGSGSRRAYTFSTPGEYLICYRYTGSDGCQKVCCKRILITDPFDCAEITSSKSGNNYTLFLSGVNNSNISRWVDDETGNVLTTNSNQINIPVPVPGDCRYYSVTYYDSFSGCYRICCIQVCGEAPCSGENNNHFSSENQECSLVRHRYNRSLGGLAYTLSVPNNLPSNGTWEVSNDNGNLIVIGSGREINYRFPSGDRYLICYRYKDSNGCDQYCCRSVLINNPLDCSIINATQVGNNYVLSLSNSDNSDILEWIDDATGNVLNTSNSQITVPVPNPEECRYYSVTYYNVFCDCYQVCCIKVCGPTGGDDCCPGGDATLSRLTDIYKNICDCGASIYCYEGNGFSGYFVYTGYLCCSKGTGTIFDCQGNIRSIESVPPNPIFNGNVGDLLWDGCTNTGGPVFVQDNEEPAFLGDYPWLSDIVDFSNCSGTSIEVHQSSSSNFVYVITPSSSVLYSANGTTWCTSGPGLNCIDFYSNGVLDRWTCGSNFTEEPCEVNPENCNTNRVVLPNNQTDAAIKEVKIFPNPSQGRVFIDFPADDILKTINVYDVSGKLVDTFNTLEKGASGQIEVDLSEHTSGMYLLQMESEHQRITKRIILD